MFRNFRSLVRTNQFPIAWKVPNKRYLGTDITPSNFPTFNSIYRFARNVFIGTVVLAPMTLSVIFPQQSLALIKALILSIENYQNLKEIKKDFTEMFAAGVADSTYEVELREDDVERKEIEKLITNEMTKKPNGKYCVIYGNNAVGKTSLVAKCAAPGKDAPKKGYVQFAITNACSPNDVLGSLLKKFQIKPEDQMFDPQILNKAMKKVYEQNKTYPVIIFEVERGSTQKDVDVINNVRVIAKFFTDGGICNCIIVISETNAIAHFGKDESRETYIFVDELSVTEATTFLKSYFPDLSNHDMKTKIFDKIGTHPGTLRNLVDQCKGIDSIDKFVQGMVSNASRDLINFPFQSILKALKDLPNPDDGVDPSYFENRPEKGVELTNQREVGMATTDLRVPNVILYRMDTQKYHLLSTAHKTALKDYNPRTPPRTWFEFLTGKGLFY